MQPETYSTPIRKIEVKTPTNAVKKIFFRFFPLTPNRGKKKEKISAQPHSGFIVPPPVGHFAPNGYALYDMAGNVFEWCNDWQDSYTSSAQTNPTGPVLGASRILRGGSWRSYANDCRVARRFVMFPSVRYDFLGFRLARNYAGEITTVPNLFMMSRANAQAAIAAAGLVVGTVTEDTSPVVPKGCVMGQNLAVGSNVPMASVVNILKLTDFSDRDFGRKW